MAGKKSWNEAYIALGANLGPRLANLCLAVELLSGADDVDCLRRSSIYETTPVGGPTGQDDYLNAVICVRTSAGAGEFLERCLEIEARRGRRRSVPHAPRVLDLDLLLFGRAVISTETLTVPHPRLHARRFVLEPLAEIAPHLRHPVCGTTMEDLLAKLPPHEEKCRPFPAAQWSAMSLPGRS